MTPPKEPKKKDIVYAVITKIPEEKNGVLSSGNLYHPILYTTKGKIARLHMRAEVFEVSEILILDNETGREVSGQGRKPSKWDVEVEEFSKIEDAIKRAREVATSY